jgi:aspartyl-tRNA(Asn)/glutamyl-tRNA(Gln) amidotransferase subunit C
MSAPHLDIAAIATLARLELTPEEQAAFGAQLDRVLEHIAVIERADIADVQPTAHASPVFNVIRDDIPAPGLDQDSVLALAPRQAHKLFLVPKVLE